MTYASLSATLSSPRRAKDGTISADIVVFDKDEHAVIDKILQSLQAYAPGVLGNIADCITTLEQLAMAVSRYPSIQQSTVLAGEQRSEETLIETLCSSAPDSRLLTLPTKVILGKSFLIAKFQTFTALTKIAMNAYFEESDIQSLRRITLRAMFALMAEDVYTTLLDNGELEYDIRKNIASLLTELWEHRLDEYSSSFAGVLHKVWTARNKLAPNFGTMLGVSELFLLSMELDESWERFMIAKMADPEIGQALEEFLFGITTEKINYIRTVLQERKLSALSREEAYQLVGVTNDLPPDDPRTFYTSFIERKNSAESRRRLQVAGPKRTLEDLYIQFIFESQQTQ
ncbi:hypothetical protein [Treponema sp.]|uniref:hypothetical protein n=1 Tax=Treponema sp. TaxID=166 RepID=UPI003FA31EEC